VDPKLNQFLWSKGIRNVARRVRVRLSRKKNEDEEGASSFYTLCQHIPVESFKTLQTEVTKLKK
jgi:large subunit ribosomal protein L31e